MKIQTVKGSAGVDLHVREYGNSTGVPILLVHGWSQSHLCWSKQYESALKDDARIVALDLRGHGMSDAPAEIDQYTDGDKWADDIAAVIDQLALERPILVGWSYAGYIISDYVRRKGQDKIAGINFVAAAVVLIQKAFGTLVGPGFLENAPGACQNDLPTNIAAMRRFLRACFVKPVSQDDFEEILAFNMVVKPHVRGALIRRELDFASLLEGITVPVLVTHGRSDTVVLPAMADYILKHCKSAEPSWYEGVGHAPFLEEPLRFNSELNASPRAHTTERLAHVCDGSGTDIRRKSTNVRFTSKSGHRNSVGECPLCAKSRLMHDGTTLIPASSSLNRECAVEKSRRVQSRWQ